MPQEQEVVTIETILAFLKRAVQEKHPLHPSIWLDEAQKLSVLLEDVDDALIDAEMQYREARSKFMDEGASGVEAETKAKATEDYRRLLSLRAKRERVYSTIQIAKKRTDLRATDM